LEDEGCLRLWFGITTSQVVKVQALVKHITWGINDEEEPTSREYLGLEKGSRTSSPKG
jgi:hypothetical protein